MGEPQSSNISASDLDEETKEKLKGDMIGDTFYSKSFVLKTLMNLSDLKYCDEMEEDLCFLWDMTIDKDVCKYLFQLEYPSLAVAALANCTECRYTEILIGILANIFVADCEKNISENEVKLVLQEHDTYDPAILIQLMRFIEALSYAGPEHVRLLGSEIVERMQFILQYSENFSLITHTMQALIRLTDDFKLAESEVNSVLFKSVIEGFDTIFSVETNNFEIEIDTEETSRTVKIFFRLLTNMCAYAQKYHNDDNDIPTAINSSGKLAISIYKILKHFSEEKNLLPLITDFNEYIDAIQTIVLTCDVNIVQDVDNNFFKYVFDSSCKILSLLHSCKSEVLESFNSVLEFIGYLIYLVDQEIILSELTNVHYKRRITVLNSLKESSRTFEFDISDKLRFLFSEFK